MDNLLIELKQIIAKLEKMNAEELIKCGSGPGMYGMTTGFGNGVKLDLAIDIALDLMTSCGVVGKEEEKVN